MQVSEPLRVGGVVIEEVDYRSLTDDQIVLYNAFGNVLLAESHPEEPQRSVEMTAAEVRGLPEFFVVRTFWGLDEDGSLAAQGYAYWRTMEDNQHAVELGIEICPELRRRGIARELLRLLAAVGESEGRTMMFGRTTDRVPEGQSFARRVGAEAALAQHINRLVIADVDRELVRRWIDDGPARAPGYRLETIDLPYPDDELEAITDLFGVMNTAPRDNLQMEDRKLTSEHVRQWERSMLAIGIEEWGLFARHEATGELVGYTEVRLDPHEPNRIQQGDTGVLLEHRGHALGKWLKASMLERILAERPSVEEIRTGNADSNAPMLGINRALGFKPYTAHTSWQVPLERVRAYLDGSSV